MCGEKHNLRLAQAAKEGSPPRVRGKVFAFFVCRVAHGITPACAGKSRNDRNGLWIWQDHPRVCGEKRCSLSRSPFPRGSPPRVRGKVFLIEPAFIRNRITPACAGKSSMDTRNRGTVRDHPRVCGEKRKVAAVCGVPAGSPPRVRGKGKAAETGEMGEGITPACAGKSRLRVLLNCL